MSFELTRTKVSLLLYAADVATLLATYNRIEVLRAPAPSGTFELVTSLSAAQPASISAGRVGPYRLSEATISLELPDGSTLSHQFAVGSPLTAQEVADELNAASVLLDCYDNASTLVLRTVGTGTGACLRVAGGDACWWLALELNASSFGLSPAPTLGSGTVIYSLSDLNGSLDYTYRYRFAKVAPPAQSVEYDPVAVGQDVTLDLASLAVGHLHVAEMSGMAGEFRVVHVVNKNVPPSSATTLVVGDQQKTLDPSGNAAFALMRGSTIEFYVAGSPLHRVITVPDMDEFDMLDSSLSQDDPWGIVQTPYTALPRTTLP